jgi:DNA polymerase-3 subunit gamma/tau
LSYLVLARKWRPSTFEEVVGQAHVTRTLVNAVQLGRVGHAYLFSGPRGVGKTTTARLLAKSLNCPNAKGAIPCNDCDVCREITAGVSLDVIEIDAASNRGIDEIRNLRENVKYAPAGGKYKVYVVDEVHMLTDAAFNALLKTLEEPPPHVKFILATTAPLKVPETILSRCQRFEFVRIPTRDVFTRLKHICSKESFKVKDEVLMLLSRRANGSLRDAESMLDQLVSAGLEEADETDVAQLLGLSGPEVFFSVIDAVKARDARKALEILGSLFDRGANLDEFTDGLMEHLRNLLLIKIHPDLASLVEASSGHVKRYEEQATQFTEGDILRLINIASRASFSVRRSALPRLHLEMAIVEMSYLDSTTQLSELIEKLESLEASLSSGVERTQQTGADLSQTQRGSGKEEQASQSDRQPSAQPRTSARAVTGTGPSESRAAEANEATETIVKPTSAMQVEEPADTRKSGIRGVEVTTESLQKWSQVLSRITSRKKSLGVCLSAARFREISQGKVILGFKEDKSFEQSIVEHKVNKKILQEELAQVFKATLEVTCVRIESDSEETAEEVSTAEDENDYTKSTSDDSLKTILEYFDGEIIED